MVSSSSTSRLWFSRTKDMIMMIIIIYNYGWTFTEGKFNVFCCISIFISRNMEWVMGALAMMIIPWLEKDGDQSKLDDVNVFLVGKEKKDGRTRKARQGRLRLQRVFFLSEIPVDWYKLPKNILWMTPGHAPNAFLLTLNST